MAEEAELRALLLGGLQGHPDSHRHFLMEAAGRLRAYFRNRLRHAPEDAEDLVQETLVALHTRSHTYDASYPVTAWLYAIARYRLIDHLRRQKRRGPHQSIDDIEIGQPDKEMEAFDARRDVATLLEKLPAKQRTAIQLTRLEDKSVKEAAEITGYSESDIKISIHRGLKSLMRLIAQKGSA